MQLAAIDWVIIGAYVAFAMVVGVVVSKRASTSVDEYFVAGRKLPWWVAGTSIVATSFAIDTPLLVSGWARSEGIWRNWSWWCYAITTLLGVFVFARLWRRGEVVTKAELSELRYGGPGARALRATLGVFHAALMNTMVMAWVLLAFIKVAEVLLGIDPITAVVIACLIAMAYSLLGGFWGVVVTDVVQFAMATVGAIWFAALAWQGVGSLTDPGVLAAIPEGNLAFFPARGVDAVDWNPLTWTTAAAILCVNLGIGWFASEGIDGSSLVVQRVAAARSERDGTLAMLWYGVANYALRPWPWIVVGLLSLSVFRTIEIEAQVTGTVTEIGAAGIVVQPAEGEPVLHPLTGDGELWVPELGDFEVSDVVEAGQILAATDHEKAYPAMMVRFLPFGILGLVVASLLAAFMSTIDTHVNLASSFFTNDLYRRFLAPGRSDGHYVLVARLASVGALGLGAFFAMQIGTIGSAFLFFIAFLGGVGPVYAMRWLWWRVRPGSEIAAMVTSGATTILLTPKLSLWHPSWPDSALSPDGVLAPEGRLLLVVLASTAAALVTLVVSSRPDPKELVAFYRRFRPPGFWGPVRAEIPDLPPVRSHFVPALVGTLAGLGVIWGLMLGAGYVLVGDAAAAWWCVGAAGVGGVGVGWVLKRQHA